MEEGLKFHIEAKRPLRHSRDCSRPRCPRPAKAVAFATPRPFSDCAMISSTSHPATASRGGNNYGLKPQIKISRLNNRPNWNQILVSI